MADQAHVLRHIQVIVGEPGDVKAVGAVLEDQIGRAVVVDELADVAALVAQRAEILEELVVAVHRIAGGHAHAGDAVSAAAARRAAAVEVHVHHELPGLGVVVDLGPFQDPAVAQDLRVGVGRLDDVLAKGPVRQVLRGVATDVAQRAVQALGPLFAEPVIGIADLDDAAAVGLDVLASVVRPDRAGNDRLADRWRATGRGRRGSRPAARERSTTRRRRPGD